MRKLDEIDFFRRLLWELKKRGMNECNIIDISEKLFPFFENEDYARFFRVTTGKFQRRVITNNIIDYFLGYSKELKETTGEGIYINNPSETRLKEINRKQEIIISGLADLIIKYCSLEEKYDVKFYGGTPNLTYSILEAIGKYAKLSQMLVIGTNNIKVTTKQIDPSALYECILDGTLCTFDEGINRKVKPLEKIDHAIILSEASVYGGTYRTTHIHTNREDFTALEELAKFGKNASLEFEEMERTKAPKILVRKTK